jgi:hypothetical protein
MFHKYIIIFTLVYNLHTIQNVTSFGLDKKCLDACVAKNWQINGRVIVVMIFSLFFAQQQFPAATLYPLFQGTIGKTCLPCLNYI